MEYLYLQNPNVGPILVEQDPFHHVFYFHTDHPMLETYETNMGYLRVRVRQDARMWLNDNLPYDHRVHPEQRIIAFRTREAAMMFKLVWG